jgi:hypothetical protein
LKHFAVDVLYETQTKAARAFKLDNVDAFTKEDMTVLFLYLAGILWKILMRFVSIITERLDDDDSVVGLKQAVETELK